MLPTYIVMLGRHHEETLFRLHSGFHGKFPLFFFTVFKVKSSWGCWSLLSLLLLIGKLFARDLYLHGSVSTAPRDHCRGGWVSVGGGCGSPEGGCLRLGEVGPGPERGGPVQQEAKHGDVDGASVNWLLTANLTGQPERITISLHRLLTRKVKEVSFWCEN